MISRSYEEKHSIALAAAALESILQGTAHLNDDGLNANAPDLRIETWSGIIFAEVTQEVHHADAEAAHVLSKNSQVHLAPGAGHWLVWVKPTVRISSFRKTLPEEIAKLPKARGVPHFLDHFIAFPGGDSPDVADLNLLPHDDGLPMFADDDPGAHMAAVVTKLAGLPDNARKLGVGPSALVIHTHLIKTNLAAQHVLQGGISGPPTLPRGCEYVLVLPRLHQARILVFTPQHGWKGSQVISSDLWRREREIRARWRG